MEKNCVAKTKRMGPRESETSHALLDAVERVMRDEGYAAATSRRVAELAGVTQQLVYYYFNTIDEVLLAAFRRRTERGLVRLEEDIASGKPVRAIWADHNDATDARLTFEYMALANRHDGIRLETAKFLEKARDLQSQAIAKAYAENGFKGEPVSPAAMSFLIVAVNLLLSREKDAGMTAGHEDIEKLVEWVLEKFE